MTIWDVRARMGNRGHTEASVARKVGRSRSHVSKVLLGQRRSRLVEEALAEAAGLSVEKLRRLLKRAA